MAEMGSNHGGPSQPSARTPIPQNLEQEARAFGETVRGTVRAVLARLRSQTFANQRDTVIESCDFKGSKSGKGTLVRACCEDESIEVTLQAPVTRSYREACDIAHDGYLRRRADRHVSTRRLEMPALLRFRQALQDEGDKQTAEDNGTSSPPAAKGPLDMLLERIIQKAAHSPPMPVGIDKDRDYLRSKPRTFVDQFGACTVLDAEASTLSIRFEENGRVEAVSAQFFVELELPRKLGKLNPESLTSENLQLIKEAWELASAQITGWSLASQRSKSVAEGEFDKTSRVIDEAALQQWEKPGELSTSSTENKTPESGNSIDRLDAEHGEMVTLTKNLVSVSATDFETVQPALFELNEHLELLRMVERLADETSKDLGLLRATAPDLELFLPKAGAETAMWRRDNDLENARMRRDLDFVQPYLRTLLAETSTHPVIAALAINILRHLKKIVPEDEGRLVSLANDQSSHEEFLLGERAARALGTLGPEISEVGFKHLLELAQDTYPSRIRLSAARSLTEIGRFNSEILKVMDESLISALRFGEQPLIRALWRWYRSCDQESATRQALEERMSGLLDKQKLLKTLDEGV